MGVILVTTNLPTCSKWKKNIMKSPFLSCMNVAEHRKSQFQDTCVICHWCMSPFFNMSSRTAFQHILCSALRQPFNSPRLCVYIQTLGGPPTPRLDSWGRSRCSQGTLTSRSLTNSLSLQLNPSLNPFLQSPAFVLLLCSLLSPKETLSFQIFHCSEAPSLLSSQTHLSKHRFSQIIH